MNTYKTKGITTINGGVLLLSPNQAAARAYALNPVGDGKFEIIKQVQFKAGEKFGFDGDLPKHLAVELVGSDKPRASKTAKLSSVKPSS